MAPQGTPKRRGAPSAGEGGSLEQHDIPQSRETRDGRGIRLRYQYRALILRGKVRLSLDAARRLVGPDCAYHLYSSGYGERGVGTGSGRRRRGKR